MHASKRSRTYGLAFPGSHLTNCKRERAGSVCQTFTNLYRLADTAVVQDVILQTGEQSECVSSLVIGFVQSAFQKINLKELQQMRIGLDLLARRRQRGDFYIDVRIHEDKIMPTRTFLQS